MVFVGGIDNGLDVVFDGAVVTGLQQSDVDDHIDLAGSVEDRAAGFICLYVGQCRPEREPDNCTDGNAGPSEKFRRLLNPAGIDADTRETELSRLVAKLPYVRFRGLGF